MTDTPLTKEQEKMLIDVYYNQKNLFGRDKLFALIKDKPNHPTQRQVNAWLSKQKVHQLHQRQFRSNPLKPTIVKTPNTVYQMDLIDMGKYEFNGWRYIATLVDVYSRQAFAIAMKNKDQATVAKAFEVLLNKVKAFHKKITVLQTDNGAEFTSPQFEGLVKQYGIHHITSIPGKPMTNGIVERFNQTLKRIIKKDLYARDDADWIAHLHTYVDNYNQSLHSSTGMTPDQADTNPNAPKKALAKAIKNPILHSHDNIKVGDTVRLKKFKGALGKQSDINWSKTTHEVSEVIRPRKPFESTRYKVEGVKQTYSRNDLQKVKGVELPPATNIVRDKDEYVVEKITEKKLGPNKRMLYKVYWRGYDEPTWEPLELVKDTEAYGVFLKNSRL